MEVVAGVTMDPKQLFIISVKQAGRCIDNIRDSQLNNDTPCSEWNLRQLLSHMIYEVLWVPDLIAGKTIAEVGDAYEGDVVGNNPKNSWQQATDRAINAVNKASLGGTAHLSYGDAPLSQYINEVAADIFIHSWDVDQAVNCTLLFDPEVAEVIYQNFLPRQQEMALSGLYGTAVDMSDDSDLQTKLLALFGRKSPALT